MSNPDANEISAELLDRWRSGDEAAAEALFSRYASRLISLVRGNVSEKLARRFDAEDVVHSAYRSFFLGARDGRFLLQHSGDLWALLVGISLNKLRRQVERHSAKKREVDRERDVAGSRKDQSMASPSPDALSKEPEPHHAMLVADEIELLIEDLDPLERRMLGLRLEGYNLDEIAADTRRSQRTVRRVMDRLKSRLSRRAEELSAS